MFGRQPDPPSTEPLLLRWHYTNPLLIGTSTAVLLFSSLRIHARFVKRIPNVDALGPEWLTGRRIRGVVTSVGDADNFRLFHKPPLWFGRVPTTRAALKDQTIHIRLAGVDAPELAHFGNLGQPHSAEAMDWLTTLLHGRTVWVRPYSKDRYGRVVGMVFFRPFPWIIQRNVSEEMLKAGVATVYTQAGAVHGGHLSRFEQLEADAKRKRRGMWANGEVAYESPGDYKKRVASDKK